MFRSLVPVIGLLACSEHSSDQSIQETLQILDRLRAAPEQVVDICSDIQRTEHRENCFLLGFDLFDADQINGEEICAQSPRELRDECFFRLAERSMQPSYCSRTTSFADRCTMHVFNIIIQDQKVNLFQDALTIAIENDVPLHHGTYSIIYHHLLSREKVVRIERCDAERYPRICEEAASLLFRRRLQDLDINSEEACGLALRFPDFDHPLLQREKKRFMDKRCQ